jgi:hypothetical protein
MKARRRLRFGEDGLRSRQGAASAVCFVPFVALENAKDAMGRHVHFGGEGEFFPVSGHCNFDIEGGRGRADTSARSPLDLRQIHSPARAPLCAASIPRRSLFDDAWNAFGHRTSAQLCYLKSCRICIRVQSLPFSIRDRLSDADATRSALQNLAAGLKCAPNRADTFHGFGA